MEVVEKNRVNVVIDGKEYTVIGTESEEYITHIAGKVDEVIKTYGRETVGFTMKMVLASLNLADEAEKKNGRIAELETLLALAEEKNAILQMNLNSLRSEARSRKESEGNDE